MGAALDQALQLTVPQHAASVRTVRLFAAASARHFGYDEETVEDIRLGLSEVAGALLAGDVPDEHVTVRARFSDDRVAFVVEGRGGVKHDVPFAIVAGLFPDTAVEHDGERVSIAFTVERPAFKPADEDLPS